MKTILTILLFVLLPVLATAADENAALRDLAATKREAAVIMKVKSRNISSYGAFISKDGLALVDMACLALDERP